jgi:hypothetical protein
MAHKKRRIWRAKALKERGKTKRGTAVGSGFRYPGLQEPDTDASRCRRRMVARGYAVRGRYSHASITPSLTASVSRPAKFAYALRVRRRAQRSVTPGRHGLSPDWQCGAKEAVCPSSGASDLACERAYPRRNEILVCPQSFFQSGRQCWLVGCCCCNAAYRRPYPSLPTAPCSV